MSSCSFCNSRIGFTQAHASLYQVGPLNTFPRISDRLTFCDIACLHSWLNMLDATVEATEEVPIKKEKSE